MCPYQTITKKDSYEINFHTFETFTRSNRTFGF
jgi:hypothetical protein